MRPFRFPPKRLPFGLLGMLALVVAVETFETRQGDKLSHPWAGDWKHGDVAVGREARDCQVLCFGDSLMKYGVVPRIIEARLKVKAYNLALGAAPPPISYYMLEHAIQAGARPKAILVDFAPHLLSEGPEISSLLLPEVLRVPDCVALGWATRNPTMLADLTLSRIFPTIKDRIEIRGAIASSLRGDDRSLRDLASAAARRNWDINRGSHVAVRGNRAFGDDAPWSGHLYPVDWRCSSLNRGYVTKFLKLAGAHSIPVFWLIPPFSPEVHFRRECSGLDTRYDQFVHRVADRFPGLTVIDGRKSGYTVSVHADALHLDRRGASVFTEDVADIVRNQLDGGTNRRWVNLPPYQDRPADGQLEDTWQSHLAVKNLEPPVVR